MCQTVQSTLHYSGHWYVSYTLPPLSYYTRYSGTPVWSKANETEVSVLLKTQHRNNNVPALRGEKNALSLRAYLPQAGI